MKTNLPVVLALCFGILFASPRAFAANAYVTTSVYSKVSNGYVRQKMPDGSVKREYYALAKGQYVPGSEADASIDEIPFPIIAGVVARHLASKNYYLANDSKSADLLILITWGKTTPGNRGNYQNSLDVLASAMAEISSAKPLPQGAIAPGSKTQTNNSAGIGDLDGALTQMEMFNEMRRQDDDHNARILGYAHDIYEREDDLSNFAGAGTYYNDLISDIEEPRYYVIIDAFDFRAAKYDGKRKVLWSTRVSIRAHGNEFNKQLAQMIANSAGYFGKGTGSLLREDHPTARVDLGELKDLGEAPQSPGSQEPQHKN
jgi:hypothetical protein